MRRARTERPENFEVDLSHPLMRGAVLLGLGQAHHSIRYRDESAKGNHGVLTNMDPATDWLWEPKLGRWALDFDGSNDYVQLPLLPPIRASACWCHLGEIPNWITLSLFATNTGYPYFYCWDMAIASNVGAWTTRGYISDGVTQVTGTAVPMAKVLTHIGLNLVGGYLDLYINGTLQAHDATAVIPIAGLAALTRVGESISGSMTCLGKLSDLCLWSSARSPADFASLADPSNVMLSGAIREPGLRRSFIGQAGAVPSVSVRYGGAFRWAGGGIGVRRGGALRGA